MGVHHAPGEVATNRGLSADMCSCGTPAAGRSLRSLLGLSDSASATLGSRSWFGNFGQIRAKCGVYSEPMVIPDTRNSLKLGNSPGGCHTHTHGPAVWHRALGVITREISLVVRSHMAFRGWATFRKKDLLGTWPSRVFLRFPS